MISHIFQKNKNNFYVLTGNFLEFFDLYMYVHLAHIIHKHYFLGTSDAFLNVFTFANLYLVAPIGCIIFAYLGDTLGRRKVIISTSILMAFCSSLVGILPTQENIGALAGFILIILRLLQGISLSGEPLASGLYVIESTPLRVAPFLVTLTAVTECLGGAVALGVAYIALDLWGEQGWRVPFYVGVVFCFYSLWLRWSLAESKEYLKYTSENKKLQARYQKQGILEFYRTLDFRHRNFFCWIGLGCAYGTAFCVSYVYLGNFLMQSFGLTIHELLFHNLKVTLCEMLIALFWGTLVVSLDLNVKKFMLFRTVIFLCCLPPILNILKDSPSIGVVFIVQVMLVSFSDRCAIAASLAKGFPVMGRYSFMAIGWAGSKLIQFLIIGVLLNLISSYGYNIAWMILVMIFMTIVFLASVFFYTPYEEGTASIYLVNKKPNRLPKKRLA